MAVLTNTENDHLVWNSASKQTICTVHFPGTRRPGHVVKFTTENMQIEDIVRESKIPSTHALYIKDIREALPDAFFDAIHITVMRYSPRFEFEFVISGFDNETPFGFLSIEAA
ncbi:MAG: hypothetical protein Q9159_006114 [Coniocarpon cinnabarinum]